MRSQKEILEKIEELTRHNNDPMGVQRKHLIRKLEWNNALPWINPKRHNDDEFKRKWKDTSRNDEKYILNEMYQFMFGAYGAWLEHEPVECLVMCQYLIIYIWLLGKKHETFLAYIIHIFTNMENNMGRMVFDEICKNYGWRRVVFMREFEEKERNKPRIITPEGFNETESGLILPEGT